MDTQPTAEPATPTSERKLESNRRNARKSTGPRTERGKSWSRRNALKHGILASQAVVTPIEGRDERKAFDQLVEGLGLDFAPVGAFEQALVQQIAACIWRQRRLLMFETRAAFQSRDDRAFRQMNQPQHGMEPLYVIDERLTGGADLLTEAGLGLDLPSERDLMKLVRYESSVTRSRRNALAQLKAFQHARRAGGGTEVNVKPATPDGPAADRPVADRPVVIDLKAARRNRGPEAQGMAPKVAAILHEKMREVHQQELRQERAAAAAAEESADPDAPASSKNDQTKPNSPEDPEVLEKHRRLLEAADAVMRLSKTLAPKRPPAED